MYYRLRQVDTDGTSSDSRILSVSISHKDGEELTFKNPIRVGEDLYLMGANDWEIRVYSIMGQPLPVSIEESDQGVRLSTHALPKGVYLIQRVSALKSEVLVIQ